MAKLWAVRVKWANKDLGGDCLKLFDTRQEARLAKKDTKALGLAEKVEIRRWFDNEGTGAGLLTSKVHY